MSSVEILARIRDRKAAAEIDRRRAESERAAILAEAKGDKPDHQWKGTRLRFEKPDGTWGKWTDLRGEKGEKGEDGALIVGGGGSSSRFNPSSLPLLPDITDTDTLILEREGSAYRVSIALLREAIGGTWPPPDVIDGGPADAVQVNNVDGGTPSNT